MNIQINEEPLTDAVKKLIYEGFSRHAVLATGFNEISEPVAFIAKNEEDFVGAVVVNLFWGALHIKYVYVEEPFRNSQIGSQLMQKAFQYGIEHACAFAYVETMSFQALEFYHKLGFELDFSRSGYSHDSTFHYLQKKLG